MKQWPSMRSTNWTEIGHYQWPRDSLIWSTILKTQAKARGEIQRSSPRSLSLRLIWERLWTGLCPNSSLTKTKNCCKVLLTKKSDWRKYKRLIRRLLIVPEYNLALRRLSLSSKSPQDLPILDHGKRVVKTTNCKKLERLSRSKANQRSWPNTYRGKASIKTLT